MNYKDEWYLCIEVNDQAMEFRSGGLIFTSKFDSGNLARVEKVSRDDDDDEGGPKAVFGELRPDFEFNVWTKPDCGGTPYENGNRSWFYFGIRGPTSGRLIKINIMNMNRQGKLYSQGHAPLVKTVPVKPKWERIRDKPYCETVDGNFYLSFTHRFLEQKNTTTYFAFCFPWSYEEQQARLSQLDQRFEHCSSLTSSSGPADSIYYHRELLCSSLDGNRIDLVTVSDLRGMQDQEEPRFDPKLFPDTKTPRCKAFKGKRVYLVSSRVHPGETPASFVFNGFLDFVVNSDDPRARALRRNFVIKLIPILNPDGVVRGHYRTDARGVNLNRMYLDPDFDLYPSIYASKSVLCYHHMNNRVVKTAPSLSPVKVSSSSDVGNGAPRASNSSNNGASSQQNPTSQNNALFTNRQSIPNKPSVRRNLNQTYNMVYSKDSKNAKTKTLPTNNAKRKSSDAAMDIENIEDLPSSESLSNIENVNTDMGKMSIQESVRASIRSSVEIASAGEFDDLDDQDFLASEGIGNEGSDDEGADCTPSYDGSFMNAPHLNDPKFREVPPNESGIAFYVDLHGHASKRGVFIYGNYFENEDNQIENMLFPKLISMNTAHFDFTGCNFTERNMYAKDKKDGLSKEGAGRVAMYKTLGIIHSYTLECNYNTGRMVNTVPPAYGDNGRATPPPLAGFPPKYTQAHFEDVGKALGVAALDMVEANPWSRLVQSEHVSVHGVKDWVRRYLRGLRGLPRGAINRPQRAAAKANSAQAAQGTSSFRGPTRPVFTSGSMDNSLQRSPYKRGQQPGGAGGSNASLAQQQRRELAPVRDAPRGAYQRVKRTQSMASAPSAVNTTAQPVAAPVLRHSISTPSTFQLTSTTETLPIASRQSSAEAGRRQGGIKPFLAPCSVMDASSVELQSVTTMSAQSNTSTKPTTINGKAPVHPLSQTLRTKKPSPPPTTHPRTSGYYSDSVIPALARQLSTDSSIHELEEEKIQQLKNIPTAERGAQSRGSKPLDAPNAKAEQAKRRGGKQKSSVTSVKRRSSSYSPNSGKPATRKLGAVNSSEPCDNDRKMKGKRKKSLAKISRKKGSSSPKNDEEEKPVTSKDGPYLRRRELTRPESVNIGGFIYEPGSLQQSPRLPRPAPPAARPPHAQPTSTTTLTSLAGGSSSTEETLASGTADSALNLESDMTSLQPRGPNENQSDAAKNQDVFWIDY